MDAIHAAARDVYEAWLEWVNEHGELAPTGPSYDRIASAMIQLGYHLTVAADPR